MAKDTEDILSHLGKMKNQLSKLEEEIKPLFDFNDLGKEIEKLKTATNKNLEKMPDMGDTCIHGNSWHSECSDCNEMNTIDDVFLLVEEYPNDAELGGAIRQLYREYHSDSDNTED